MSKDQPRSVIYAQNFLRNRQLVDQLLAESSIGPADLVIEIGPGTGLITERLAARCHHVIAIEKDPQLVQRLRHRLGSHANIALFTADVRQFPLPVTPYKVFANIPFNITTAIVSKLTSGVSPPDDAYLIVQREAAAKFMGEPRESLYAVLLKPWFERSIIHRFQTSDFTPRPRVKPVLLRLAQRQASLVASTEAPYFRDFVVFAFTAWQPTVRDVLVRCLPPTSLAHIEQRVGSSLRRQPSATPFELWLRLFAACRDVAGAEIIRASAGAEAQLRAQQAGLDKVHRTRRSSGRR